MYLINWAKITLKDSTKGQSSYLSNKMEKPKTRRKMDLQIQNIFTCVFNKMSVYLNTWISPLPFMKINFSNNFHEQLLSAQLIMVACNVQQLMSFRIYSIPQLNYLSLSLKKWSSVKSVKSASLSSHTTVWGMRFQMKRLSSNIYILIVQSYYSSFFIVLPQKLTQVQFFSINFLHFTGHWWILKDFWLHFHYFFFNIYVGL